MQTIKMENWFDSQSWNLKMASNIASKMAASNALKAYLTNKHDKKHWILTFHGCIEV